MISTSTLISPTPWPHHFKPLLLLQNPCPLILQSILLLLPIFRNSVLWSHQDIYWFPTSFPQVSQSLLFTTFLPFLDPRVKILNKYSASPQFLHLLLLGPYGNPQSFLYYHCLWLASYIQVCCVCPAHFVQVKRQEKCCLPSSKVLPSTGERNLFI